MIKEDVIDVSLENLNKHFDFVQIFVSNYENGETEVGHYGVGNLFARYGLVSLWVDQQGIDDDNEQQSQFGDKKYERILTKHVAELSEFFDTVHIFAGKETDEGSYWIHHGTGNWYARYGHIDLWVINQQEAFMSSED